MEAWGSTQVLGRYDAFYWRCSFFDFIQVENPHWLEEAYESAITTSDVGLVSRNLEFKKKTQAVIECLFKWQGKFIDYGGGTGLFTRLMRDAGYDFYWYDRHCGNCFATGFVADITDGTYYKLLTAAEVLEHLVDPVTAVREMFDLSPNILFTTELLSTPAPAVDDWWYYGSEHGQHISFYGEKTLEVLAKSLGLHFTTNGSNLHLFSERPVSPLFFKIVANGVSASIISALLRRPSLLPSDFSQVCKQEENEDADSS